MAKLKITLIKGLSKCKVGQIATVKALGLKKVNSTVEQNDTPQLRGMIKKVEHLITYHDV